MLRLRWAVMLGAAVAAACAAYQEEPAGPCGPQSPCRPGQFCVESLEDAGLRTCREPGTLLLHETCLLVGECSDCFRRQVPEMCVQGLACTGATCRPELQLGQQCCDWCAYSPYPACAPGLQCVRDTLAGSFLAWCGGPLRKDERCTDTCGKGLTCFLADPLRWNAGICIQDGGVASATIVCERDAGTVVGCMPAAGEGEPCRSHTDCAFPLFCRRAAAASTGSCQAPSGVGGPCDGVDNIPCAQGFTCRCPEPSCAAPVCG